MAPTAFTLILTVHICKDERKPSLSEVLLFTRDQTSPRKKWADEKKNTSGVISLIVYYYVWHIKRRIQTQDHVATWKKNLHTHFYIASCVTANCVCGVNKMDGLLYIEDYIKIFLKQCQAEENTAGSSWCVLTVLLQRLNSHTERSVLVAGIPPPFEPGPISKTDRYYIVFSLKLEYRIKLTD